jgi:hypothetical protein
MANNTSTQFQPKAPENNTDLEALNTRLKFLELAEREEAFKARAEAKEALQKSREAGIESIRNKMAMDAAKQRGCSHLKPNGATNLAGQKDHDGIIQLLCQGCQKTFKGNEIPAGLFPQGDGVIGGIH